MSLLQALFGQPKVQKLTAKRDVDGLIKALTYPKDTAVRRSAAEALGILGDIRAVEPLIAALADTDNAQRKAAVDALGFLRDARAVEPVTARLCDESPDVCEAAAAALENLFAGRSVEFLADALRDNSEVVRMTAIKALGNLNDPRAVEPLTAALSDGNNLRDAYNELCTAAANALDQLCWHRTNAADAAYYWIAKREWDKCIEIGAPAAEPLLSILTQKGKGKEANAAAQALMAISVPAHLVQDVLMAAAQQDYCELATSSIESGAHVDRTVLERADELGATFLVLLEKSEVADLGENIGRACLESAVERHDYHVVRFLIEKGVNVKWQVQVDDEDQWGRTSYTHSILRAAERACDDAITELLRRADAV
jgi:hypothetical protein